MKISRILFILIFVNSFILYIRCMMIKLSRKHFENRCSNEPQDD